MKANLSFNIQENPTYFNIKVREIENQIFGNNNMNKKSFNFLISSILKAYLDQFEELFKLMKELKSYP